MAVALRALRRAGVALSAEELARDVAAPIAVTAFMTGATFSVIVGARLLRLRESIRQIARLDFSLPKRDVPMDFLGVSDAVLRMGHELDRAMTRLAHNDGQRRRLFADLAHELATPTSAMLGLVDTLSDASLTTDEALRARYLDLLGDQVTRIARLVGDIRELAELDDPDVAFAMEPSDLADVVRTALEPFEVQAGAPIERILAPAPAHLDALRMEQLVVNLLTNARRYAPVDGSVRVRVAVTEGFCRLTVEDSGPGAPEDALARLGERLFRPDPSRDRRGGGHGLGLAIALAIAARHGGTIAFGRSELGGLSVTVDLPAR